VCAQITLNQCVESGLTNRVNIQSAKSEVFLASLKNIESKAKYLPQISLAYDYRYNPIIATQIVPIGQFSTVPTDETRAIQFGTNWQQSAGITLYQPIIDFAVQSRIKESKINESLSNIDLKKSETDLIFEIVKSYSRVITFDYQLEESASDTLRSFQIYTMLKAKFIEGKVLKTELNNALVNHNTNIANYRKAMASEIKEKIYLHYLTNISLERLLDEKFKPIPTTIYAEVLDIRNVQFESIPEFQRLKAKDILINQQINTERTKYAPTFGFQGFLGSNQFSQTFDPFLSNSWFGNSYLGLSIKLPILSADKSINGEKQLQTQLQINNNQKEEFVKLRNKDLLQKNAEIERLKIEISITENSHILQSENVKLYQQRLLSGQYTAIELNTQETELQKLTFQLKQLREQLYLALIERLYLSGKLFELTKKG
jgi:outer membrane protein TolC